jgi:hypothetical protein
MLIIILPATEDLPAIELQLEHSLVSLSKWESFHEKAFYGRDGMDREETKSYVQQMLLSPSPSGNWIERFSTEDYDAVAGYINSKQSATWFREDDSRGRPREIVTAELIYYWMISFQIPFEPCETWHINRLMTLIRICGIKQSKPKKMSRQAQAAEYRRLNELRREQLGSAG